MILNINFVDIFMVDLNTFVVYTDGKVEQAALPKIIDDDILEFFIGII